MMISKTIYLECIDFTIFGMIVNVYFFKGCFHFVCQVLAFFRQSLLVYLPKSRLPYAKIRQRNWKETRYWNVVASSEGRKLETIKPTGFTGAPRPSLVTVSSARLSYVGIYKDLHRLYVVVLWMFSHISDCLNPFFIVEYAASPVSLPVLISQAQRITQGVDFHLRSCSSGFIWSVGHSSNDRQE